MSPSTAAEFMVMSFASWGLKIYRIPRGPECVGKDAQSSRVEPLPPILENNNKCQEKRPTECYAPAPPCSIAVAVRLNSMPHNEVGGARAMETFWYRPGTVFSFDQNGHLSTNCATLYLLSRTFLVRSLFWSGNSKNLMTARWGFIFRFSL
ncbi:hypothetical protein BX600DRAFT_471410, partial [Xylariales sp. PMI_506]